MHISTTSIPTSSAIIPVAVSKTASVFSMVLGASFIFLIGFSHIDAVHNAAHDTRHSSAFPCH